MSATVHAGPTPDDETADEAATADRSVVVRRSAGLAALVGAGASAVAIAYLARAAQSGAVLDWALCLVMAALGGLYLAQLVDARTPLLVADELGVRIRFGHQWRGLPWEAVAEVRVVPRRGWLHDGRLMFAPHSLGRALDGLEARGRRAAAMNQRIYGAALAVPLGLTTRVSVPRDELADRLESLTADRVPVEVVQPAPPEDEVEVEEEEDETVVESDETVEPGEPSLRRRLSWGALGTAVARLAGERTRADEADLAAPVEEVEVAEPTAPLAPAAHLPKRNDPLPPAALLREVRRGLRAEVTRQTPATMLGNAALLPDHVDNRTSGLPEREVLLRHGDDRAAFGPLEADRGRVRPIAALGEPVEPLVVEDFVTEPALDPVIGPQLAAARNRVGLSVDELAERTRIRPHVIEAIEVDDFAPCGGDFYARGHLRTLARVLGQDAGPLIDKFDQRYATAPINARTVFEAELATGMTGSIRSTVGGPNWALLAGVVLVLVMVWSVVRLVASEPEEVLRSPVPALNGSAGVGNGAHGAVANPAVPPKPVRVTLTGAQGDSHVVVRSHGGKVAWAGELVLGEKRVVRAVPPLVVRASDAGAVDVRVAGRDKGLLGEPGQPARRTFHRPVEKPAVPR